MKKTTYSKSFTGWGAESDTASKIIKIGDIDLSREKKICFYDSKNDALKDFEKPRKIRVTYTVTVEPVK